MNLEQGWWSNSSTSQLSHGAIGAIALALVLGLAAVTPSAQAQTLSVLYSFTGGTDGQHPWASVIRDAAGNFYGTAYQGGDYTCDSQLGCGTVFKVDSSGIATGLHSFTGGADGAYPAAGLIRSGANLYGTTYKGGASGVGTVFKVDPSGNESVLYSFTGGADGGYPTAGLVRDAAGNLYGTTQHGGNLTCGAGCGIVFQLDATGKQTVLYTFTGASDGANPAAGLIRDASGNLYGTTYYGGVYNHGTVFRVDSTSTETVLHSFTGGGDGAYPQAGVIRYGASLYGTTTLGGLNGAGVVFKLDQNGRETVLLSFTGIGDGSLPFGSLVHDTAGNLYGTTYNGTIFGDGTVFELSSSGAETVLHSFKDNPDGAVPEAGLIRDAAGNLYGTTYYGGANGKGAIFKVVP